MRSSATKSRDMARSILPSLARSTTAHVAVTRRANRHAIGQGCRISAGATEMTWRTRTRARTCAPSRTSSRHGRAIAAGCR